jgi:long-chain acyl-CoA synthetase
MMRENLATLLDDFRRYDREIAVVRYHGVRRRVTTYGEIAALAGRFAALLVQRGIVKGDRVLIWADNSAEWIAAFHGCLLRGVIAVPLDAVGSADFAARIAADVNPALAVGDLALVTQLPAGVPRLAFEDWPASLPAQQAPAIDGLGGETPLQILFTSGTTGDPKGIVLTHGNVLASFAPIEQASQPYLRYERIAHPLRILHTLPLSHVFGQTMGLWVPSIYRAELHIESRLVASRLVETIRRERISVLAAVPRVHALLKTHLEATLPKLVDRLAAAQTNPMPPAQGVAAKAARVVKRWLRFGDVHRTLGFKFWALISGGGALPPQVESFWNTVGLVVVQGYGMTETTALITLNHPFHVASGTIGKPLAGREVKLGHDGEVLVRGAAISHATWSGGALHPRTNEWLATGDLAQTEPTGELRFVGRKSEVIVTAAGLNLHPEDLEAAIEREPGVTACAVVAVETPAGPEPCAVLALRGEGSQPAAVIEHANARLAEYQRLHRWVVWPEPDLPRTSTGKIRRKAVAAELARIQPRPSDSAQPAFDGAASSDWLLQLVTQISGETPRSVSDDLHLSDDMHLDSLGRVQLAGAIEERAGITTETGQWDRIQTLGDLRRLVKAVPPTLNENERTTKAQRDRSRDRRGAEADGASERSVNLRPYRRAQQPITAHTLASSNGSSIGSNTFLPLFDRDRQPAANTANMPARPGRHVYPRWPWSSPIRWVRTLFVEAVMRPLVRLLARPSVALSAPLEATEPMLIVANHITAYDVPLIEYALPAAMRRHIAIAMSGEMLEDFRTFRNPKLTAVGKTSFYPQGPLYRLLLTAFFNVFPLPRLRDFQRSFNHAGEALDRGMNVLLFPEGARSLEGRLARFRPGIGLLVKQSSARVLPIALRGVGELKSSNRSWFRAGSIEIAVGTPIRFSPLDTETEITQQLHDAVRKMLED